MSASVAIIPMLLLIAAALAVLTGFFALLTNPKTRPYLLGALGFVGLIVLAVFFFYFLAHRSTPVATVEYFNTYPDKVAIPQEQPRFEPHLVEPLDFPYGTNSNVNFAPTAPRMFMLGPWALVSAVLVLCGLMFALKVRGLAIGIAVALVAFCMIGFTFVPRPDESPAVATVVPREINNQPSALEEHIRITNDLTAASSLRESAAKAAALPAEDPDQPATASDASASASGTESAAAEPTQQAEIKPAPKAPGWIEQKPTRDVGIAKIGPFSSMDEIEGKLPLALLDAVDRHAQRYFGVERPASSYVVPYDFIRTHIAQLSSDNGSPYVEERQHSIGKMYTMYIRLDFSRPEVREQLIGYYQAHIMHRRLTLTGIVMALALGMLGTVFGYLKLDTVTKGYYTRRLQVTAAAITLLLICGLGFVFLDVVVGF